MKTIPVTEIVIPSNRQRIEFNGKNIQELAESIDDVGLLQAIVLRDDHKTLIAGERRSRAITLLNRPYKHDGESIIAGSIPYVIASELSAMQLHKAELEENLRRVDLTWKERAKAIAELHRVRSVETGGTQTATDTAREIRDKKNVTGNEITEVSAAILLEEWLDDPIVAVARDESEARKIIRDELKAREKRERLSEFEDLPSRHQLRISSCYDTPPPDGTFDCIVTDPPYGINIHKKDTFDTDKHEYDDSDEAFAEVLARLPTLAYNACKADAHIFVFCDIRRFTELFVAFEVVGWTVWPRPVIWDKGNTGSFGGIQYGFRSCYDAILFARKGDKQVTAGYRDVIPITQPTNLPHPAGKPVDLYVNLLQRSCLPGDVVGDFFCGHGPIFPAAEKLYLTAWGWEKHDKYAQMAQTTLAQIKSDSLRPGG